MVSTVLGRRSISTRQSIVLPLPTSPVTLTMPSPAVIAYSRASSVAPRFAPAKKNSVWGVIRNGASRSPKCSRYIVMGVRREGGALSLCLRPRSSAGIGSGQFSTRSPRRFEPSVEGAARHAQDLRRLRHVALCDVERRLEVGLLDPAQRLVEAERAPGQQLRARLGDGVGTGGLLRRRGELGFQLRLAHGVARVFRGEADHDVLQLAHVAGEGVARPARARAL